nr:MAG TPA: hypothetical protein [Caudoviricetes sp.]
MKGGAVFCMMNNYSYLCQGNNKILNRSSFACEGR